MAECLIKLSLSHSLYTIGHIYSLARAPTITLSSHDLVQVGLSSRPYVEYQDRQWVAPQV